MINGLFDIENPEPESKMVFPPEDRPTKGAIEANLGLL
jgi:hypothetical protein